MTFAEQHLLRGLVALHALDARLLKDKRYYKLKNRMLEAVARRPEASVLEYIDGEASRWLFVSASSYSFRLPWNVTSDAMRARASYAHVAPQLTPAPEGDIDVEAELRALDDAGRVLCGKPPTSRPKSVSAHS